MSRFLWSSVAVAASLFCVDTAQAVPYRAATSSAQALKTLQLTAGNQAFVSTLPDDRFTAVKAPVGKVIAVDNASAPALTRALAFLAIHGAAMGVQNPAAELKWVRTSTDAKGGVHVHMEQMHEGLHVFGARLIVHMNEQGITGVNGVFLPDASEVSTTPSQTFEALRERAFMAAGKLHPKVPRSDLRIESSRLVIYNTGLLQSLKGGNRLAYDVVVKGALGGEPVREQLFIDANSGLILNRINRIETVLHRKTYTPVYGNALVYEDGKGPTSVPPVAPAPTDPPFTGDTTRTTPSTRPNYNPPEALHLYAGGTWKMYKLMLGRDGYNEDGPKPIPATGMVQESVYLVNNNCPNAYWDGTAASYCPGFDLDDVVSHEWSHAYTEYMDGLIYSYQSGALNEAYSDIYGETYDLINGFEGKAGSTLTEGKYYKDGGSRWYVGEDLSDAAASLLLRDMWDPDDFMSPSPGKVGSTNYECGTGDGGGVHTNSGVPNHAYAMLVDGRPNAQDPTTFNNVPVPKIGLFKAAHIFFAAKRDYQTPSTNFPEHADALDMACQDLLGVNVKGLNGQPSGEIVTQADCNAVKQAALSVAYRAPVKTLCNYVPVLLPESSTPALCATGRSPKKIFREGFNQVNFPSNWTKGMELAPVGNTTIANWTLSKNLPAPHSGSAAFFKNDKGGDCSTVDHSGSYWIDSPAITVPTADTKLMVNHLVQTEGTVDGGQLYYAINGSTTYTLVPQAAMTPTVGYNAHSSLLDLPPPLGNNTNTQHTNQRVWSGTDQGEAFSTWGTTIVDLNSFAAATRPAVGATIKFRFLFTHDGCNGNLGWFIDQVDAYHCVVNNPPVAAFKAVTPASGTSPLTVNFDASTSADADAGDSVVAFVVDFGDGSPVETFSVPLFTHTYTGAGDYTPKMTVRDSYELASSQITSPVTIKVTVPTPTNVAPTAAFKTITPTSGNSPLNVSFDVSTSSDPDAGDSIVEYVVDFGDGTMQSFTTATFSHTYTSSTATSFTPKLTVKDSKGATSAQATGSAISITVPTAANRAPTAAFTSIMPSNGTAPLNAMFDVSASADPDSGDSVVSYVVDFGDGTTQTFTTPTFNHSYTSAGNYTPKLTVTDKQGLSSTQATSPVVVNVTAPVQGNTAPTASFKSVSPATGEASLTVSFDVSTSSDPDVGDLITSYIVDFGDGSTEVFTTPSFTHVYTKAGSYTPKLTVMDRNGATSVQVISATVVTVSATVVVAVKPVSVQTGRFGGGSLDFGVLLGLLLLARRRR